jgi:hypothetical protein
VQTEYSTFTYYLTSLIGGETVIKTDIIVSSNVVTQRPQQEITPTVEPSPSPTAQAQYETKTYFTTSTYFSTYVDQSRTVTRKVDRNDRNCSVLNQLSNKHDLTDFD